MCRRIALESFLKLVAHFAFIGYSTIFFFTWYNLFILQTQECLL